MNIAEAGDGKEALQKISSNLFPTGSLLFEEADGGTIFLDEVSNLSLSMQTRLLRFLQEHEIKRVGGTESKEIDVRVIAATNKNIEEMVSSKTFREDLYYRLNVVPIHIPPIRERREDILPLIFHFLEKFNKEFIKCLFACK
jgi:transcriptional regulator with PAS, ATPase and Fis domain